MDMLIMAKEKKSKYTRTELYLKITSLPEYLVKQNIRKIKNNI